MRIAECRLRIAAEGDVLERSVRLEVGYGLEVVIPDIEARRLVDATLLRQFAAGRQEDGFGEFPAALVDRPQALANDVGVDVENPSSRAAQRVTRSARRTPEAIFLSRRW
jgi:uncharacterized membrane protein YgcG